ncbi:MAG: Origin recognition complex subunit 2 [Thelocarpon superellum]|nr:MAG: Origin recognition complex subunit 2 [Thelocarpon superellum]
MKRKKTPEAETSDDEDELDHTRQKRPRSEPSIEPAAPAPSPAINGADPTTPVKRGRGRPPGSKNKPKPGINGETSYATTPTKTPLKTPAKSRKLPSATTPVIHNADRSARRKSARALIERTLRDDLDDDDDGEEDLLAQHIWDAEGSDADAGGRADSGRDGADTDAPGDEEAETGASAPPTPLKRGRGRPKGSRNKRTPTPPGDLPPHERYFFQNRSGGIHTSNHTLSSVSLLNHEEYFKLIKDHVDSHQVEQQFLQDLHARSFSQWRFEMSEGFNLCLYGLGSKRKLVLKFAEWLDAQQQQQQHQGDENEDEDETENENEKKKTPGHRIVVVNGYVSNLTIRDILNALAEVLLGPNHAHKLGSQPNDMVETLLSLANANTTTTSPSPSPSPTPPSVTLLIHSIDAPALRRPATQAILARLASQPYIQLLASADHPSFALLWDSSLREAFNYLFHDSTTFLPYELEVDVVESVNDVLGRSGRRMAGREGVGFVLRSLPENARNLYRVLVSEQLAAMDGDGPEGDADDDGDEDDEGAHAPPATPLGGAGGGRGRRQGGRGIPSRTLYQKAVEEFICTSEMGFRSLLREFLDHQMIESRRPDGVAGGGGDAGGETLWIPFRREELEAVLDDLI